MVHRIIKIEGEDVTLMGDGNISGTERCTLSDVKALATHVVGRDERPRDLYTSWRKRAAKACLMQPVVFGRAKRMGICCGSALVIVLVIAATHIGQTLWISQHDTELATPATSSADASSI